MQVLRHILHCTVTFLPHFSLRLLVLSPESVGRFRDCFLNEKLQIVVYTRNGGGNREAYESVTNELRGHPQYVEDFDDDFDCTFAYYVFNVPTSIDRETMQELYEVTTKQVGTPRERFDRNADLLGED